MYTYLCARLRDGTEVVDEVRLGHTDTGITDGENLVLFVRNDADEEVTARLKDRRVGERRITNLIERIRSIGDNLTKEDLLVAVESVYSTSKSNI